MLNGSPWHPGLVGPTWWRWFRNAYGRPNKGKLRCLVTGLKLPTRTVIAAHLYKSEWRDLVKLDLGFEDIDDIRNGLLMKPVEHAFNTSRLCIIYDKATDRFVIHVLDTSLLPVKLADRGAKLMGLEWQPPTLRDALKVTFSDINGKELQFPLGCVTRPMKRVLCYQAYRAMEEAARKGWHQIQFEDFWTEGESYLEKVAAWNDLAAQTPESALT